jgi:hypothetical protein
MSDNLSPFQQQLRKNNAEGGRLYAGIVAAGIPVALTMMATSPISHVFGEGDYTQAVSAILFVVLFLFGVRIRRQSKVGSVRRTFGLWVAIYSIVIAVLTGGLALATLLNR